MVGDILQPEDEFLHAFCTDTAEALDVVAFTIPNDTLLLQNTATILLGGMNDPIFGNSTYNFVSDLNRNVLDPYVPEGATLDSVILEMAYSSSYRLDNAHKNKALTVDIFELDETLDEDSLYYTNEKPKLSSTKLLSNYTFVPNPFDTLPDSNRTVLNSLKLKLSDEFGNRLLKAKSGDFENELSCNKFFKGFAILFKKNTQENYGNIFCVHSVYDKGSGVVLYYKEANSTAQKTVYYSFGKARHTYIERDLTFASPDFKAQLKGDTTLGQQRVYIQSTGGALMQFSFPKILQLKNHKIIVNQAYLIMKNVQFDQGVNLPPPPRLISYIVNKDNTISELPDKYPNPGGYYNDKTGEYRLCVTRYIQSLLFNNVESAKIILAPYSQYTRPDQLVLYGTDKNLGANRMHLKLIYTQIPE
ncbi:MAG: DUF4270 family protein [Bacteroidales bacterium]